MSAYCCFRVYGVGRGFSGSNCRVKATFEHEGHAYCRMHYPPNVDAKDAARRQKWVAETAMQERLRSEAAEQKRRSDLYPELLAALQDMLSGWRYIRDMHGDLYGVGWDRAQDKAEAAVAKATGAA